jgi:putative salt-induced outer membrane protein YdiY
LFSTKKKIGERFYGYPFVEAFHNEPARIEHRLTAGLGIGYYLVQTEKMELTFDGGTAYLFEKLTDEEEDDYMTFYLGIFHKLAMTETSRIWEGFKIFPKIEELGDYMIKAEAGIETDISSAFSLRFVVQDNYDTDPPEGADDNDLSVVGSLVFKI